MKKNNIRFRKFKKGDFKKIRDFLVNNYNSNYSGGNWKIDRWNFCASMSRILNYTTKEKFESKVGIWEDETGEIVALVNSEGENSGEAFFQINMNKLDKDIYEELFDFIEANLTISLEGKKFIQLRILDNVEILEDIANKRGYKKLEWAEITSSCLIKNWKYKEIEGEYTIKNGDEVSDYEKAEAHATAFGYLDKDIAKVSPLAYEEMAQMPDYRPDLDLYLVNEADKIVSFCTLWFDEKNKIGIVEPMGTHHDFRRKGLGYGLLSEGVKRLFKLGANEFYVGSDQEFYLNIGFNKKFKNDIWEFKK